MQVKADEDVASKLKVAQSQEVAAVALEVACRPKLRRWWGAVAKRLAEVELDALDAILVLHCLVRLGISDRQLLSKVVDQIEGRYFAMQLGMGAGGTCGGGGAPPPEYVEEHAALQLFPPRDDAPAPDSFQALVDRLPVDHKVKMVVMDNVGREDGRLREKPLPPEPDAKKRWRTLDPVELEEWERRQYDKGRIWIKRIRAADAKVSRMRPGNKLAATLSLQLFQALPAAPPGTLAQLAQICAFAPRVRPLHGDLLEDFRELLSRRVAALDTHQVRPYVLAFASALRDAAGPEACRAWRRKLVPAALQVLSTARSPLGLQVFDLQVGFHSHLRGVPHCAAAGSPSAGSSAVVKEAAPGTTAPVEVAPEDAPREAEAAEDTQSEEAPQADAPPAAAAPLEEEEEPEEAEAVALRRRTERAAGLFLAFATARQVDLDCQLFDALAAPVKAALRQHLSEVTSSSALPPADAVLLPLETIADLLDACASCGVDDAGAELPQLLLQLLALQFGDDVRSGDLQLSGYAMADLSALAHAASLLCSGPSRGGSLAEEALQLLWSAAQPKLRHSEPHLVLMLLDAVVRGGSDQLLASKPVTDAVDEHLVQRLDMDPSRLGRLGV